MLFLVAELELESKRWAFANFAREGDVAVELADNLVGDDEAQANAFGVHLLGLLDKSKQFE